MPSWLTQPPPITFDLSPSFWWSGTPLFPAALPTGQGSVKAARIVDSGQCSHREPLTPILSQVNNTLWTEFIKEVQMEPEPDGAIRHASNAIVYLDHVEGDPTDQRGGFFLSSFFTIVLEEIFTVDIDICFNVEYQLAINGYPFVGDPASTGILSAIPALNHAASVGTNAQDALDALTTALTGRVPLTFLEETTKRQLFPVGVTCTEAPPEVGGTANCSTAAAGFEDNLVIGGPIAGLVEAEIEQLMVTANQAHDLAPQEIPVPWFTGLRNWRCIRDPDTHPEGVGECHYVVRAKRLNVGSNFVELVWFDGKELFNPTYALWVAAQAGSLPGQPNPDLDLLCSWQAAGKAFVAPGFVPRPFGRSELGFTSVPFP